MKKCFPLVSSLVFLILIVFIWDYIKLPYNNENVINGEYYLKKFNPLNETLRFLLFILLPSLVYFISYLLINKETYNLNLNSPNYFLQKKHNNFYNSLNFYFFLFILLILLEFLSVNFSVFVYETDVFHEGSYLVPPLNYLKNNELFRGTFHDYGLIANNFGLISKYFLGFYSIGSIKFFKLLLFFLIKLFLVFISKKIASNLNLEDTIKKIFFIVLTFFAIGLSNYYDFQSNFSFRHAFYVFFVFMLGSTLCSTKNLNLKFFFVGIFSLISMLWWYDIGAYANILIAFSIIYLLIHRKIQNTLFIVAGIFLSWIIFFLILPSEEIKEFLFQINLIYSSVWEYMLGIEYRKPFSAGSGRWTKALLIIYTTSIILVNLNFSKKFYVSHKTKIFVNLLFISGVLIFKSALMRSDSFHIKYSSGLYTYVFVLILMLFLFQRLDAYKKIQYLTKNISKETLSKSIFLFYIGLAFLFFSGTFNKSDNTEVWKKLQNIKNSKTNIKYLIEAQDDLFLNKNTKSILKYYKKISKDDNCIQIFTDDVAFPYFLRKPTCTQFYVPAQVIIGHTEKKFINQLELASPNIILYKSPHNILTNYSNMPKTIKYIKKKYSFFENYNNYIFYKKN